jgi:predicted XRE-type DNA-binding protein
METQEITTPKNTSLICVIWKKFVLWIDETPSKKILTKVVNIVLTMMLYFALKDPEMLIKKILSIISYENYSGVKIVSIYIVINNVSVLKKIYKNTKKYIESKKIKGELIEGIPVVELIDHLITEKNFKRSEIESKFGIPRHRYTNLAKKLEEVGVLIRGENNSRILNDDYARQDIFSVLSGAKDANNITGLFRVKTNGITTQPRGQIIKKHQSKYSNNTPLSPLPDGFYVKKLKTA